MARDDLERGIRAFHDEQRVLVLSLRCNNHCRFCFYSLRDRATRDDPDLPTIARTLAQWHAEGVRTVNLHGGEPTIAPTFRKTLELLRAWRLRYVLSSNVRAFAVERFAERVLQTPPAEVLTTVLGADAATHDGLTRAPGSHAQTMAGIRRLRAAGVPVNVHVVILRPNHTQLPALVDTLVAEGCSLKFSFPVFSGEARESAREIAVPVSAALPFLQEAVRRLDAARAHYFVAKAQICLWPERLEQLVQQVSDRADNRHFPCCDGCRFRDRCDGISETYAGLFGTAEFRAVPDPLPAPGPGPASEGPTAPPDASGAAD